MDEKLVDKKQKRFGLQRRERRLTPTADAAIVLAVFFALFVLLFLVALC